MHQGTVKPEIPTGGKCPVIPAHIIRSNYMEYPVGCAVNKFHHDMGEILSIGGVPPKTRRGCEGRATAHSPINTHHVIRRYGLRIPSIHIGRSHNGVIRNVEGDPLFTFELERAVDIERSGGIVFAHRLIAIREHIITRNINKTSASLSASIANVARRLDVKAAGCLGMRLAIINTTGCIRAVKYASRLNRSDNLLDAVSVSDIEIGKISL